jgi:hypothetical protein
MPHNEVPWINPPPPSHLLWAVTPIFPSTHIECVHTNAGSDNHMMTFRSNKHFGFTDRPHQNTSRMTCKEWEAPKHTFPTIYVVTSFCGLSIITVQLFREPDVNKTYFENLIHCWFYQYISFYWRKNRSLHM